VQGPVPVGGRARGEAHRWHIAPRFRTGRTLLLPPRDVRRAPSARRLSRAGSCAPPDAPTGSRRAPTLTRRDLGWLELERYLSSERFAESRRLTPSCGGGRSAAGVFVATGRCSFCPPGWRCPITSRVSSSGARSAETPWRSPPAASRPAVTESCAAYSFVGGAVRHLCGGSRPCWLIPPVASIAVHDIDRAAGGMLVNLCTAWIRVPGGPRRC